MTEFASAEPVTPLCTMMTIDAVVSYILIGIACLISIAIELGSDGCLLGEVIKRLVRRILGSGDCGTSCRGDCDGDAAGVVWLRGVFSVTSECCRSSLNPHILQSRCCVSGFCVAPRIKLHPPTILIPTLEGVPAIPVFELTGYPTRAIGPVVWYVLRGFCPLETALVTISGLALGTA